MPDPLDPNKYHVMSPKQKKILIIVGIFFALIVVPTLTFFYYKLAVKRPSQMDRDVTVEIKSGQGLSEISSLLYQKGLLNSEILFKAFIFANHLDSNIQAGTYNIPAGTSIVGLAEILQHGKNDMQIRFTEGWRVEEYARMASSLLHNVSYDEFVQSAKPYEGFLFPDTYLVDKDTDTGEMISVLEDTFTRKTEDILTDSALSRAGLTKEQAVILASIVEREVATEEDRPIVAGILIKRWKNGELIGADATTQYALAELKNGCGLDSSLKICPTGDQALNANWWPDAANFTEEDLKFNSPFNTRQNVGLPPTPICNPGLAALQSVVNSVPTDYNYYLTDSKGVTHYARTLEEHQANINAYLSY